MKSSSHTLIVSFESRETRFAAELASSINQSQHSLASVVVTDLFQLEWEYCRTNLAVCATSIRPGKLFLLTNLLHPSAYSNKFKTSDFINSLLRSNLDYNSVALKYLKNDHIFSHYERTPFYRPADSEDKVAFILNMIFELELIIVNNSITSLFIIGSSYMGKQILADIAQFYDIKIHSLFKARLHDKYLIATGFPSNMDFSWYYPQYKTHSTKYHHLDYKSNLSYCHANSFNDAALLKKGISAFLWLVTRKLFLNCYFLLKRRIFQKRIVIHVYSASTIRRLLFEFQKYLRLLRAKIAAPLMYKSYDGQTSLPSSYFYYPLNCRPESSTLILSNGYVDESAIRELLDYLPSSSFLLLKENPSMVAIRRYSFIRSIAKYKNVIYVNPLTDSQLLIDNALATFAISGTSLLEAIAAKKPSYAFGRPEFKNIMSSKDSMLLSDFISSYSDMPTHSLYEEYFTYSLRYGLEIPFLDPRYSQTIDSKTKYAIQFITSFLTSLDEY